MLAQSPCWSLPPDNFKLHNNEVHVWRSSLEQPAEKIQQLLQTLSEDERIRANKFYFERDRRRFIVGRGLLRILLGRYTNIEPHQLQFSYSSRGKPALLSTSSCNSLYFNLSHSHELVLYAVTRDRQIGIDLEQIRPMSDIEQLSKSCFCTREADLICSLPPKEQQVAFFQIWTGKEAYLKATGEGIAQLRQVEVCFAPGEPLKLLNIQINSQTDTRWSLQTLTPATDYLAALVVEGHDWHLDCWELGVGAASPCLPS